MTAQRGQGAGLADAPAHHLDQIGGRGGDVELSVRGAVEHGGPEARLARRGAGHDLGGQVERRARQAADLAAGQGPQIGVGARVLGLARDDDAVVVVELGVPAVALAAGEHGVLQLPRQRLPEQRLFARGAQGRAVVADQRSVQPEVAGVCLRRREHPPGRERHADAARLQRQQRRPHLGRDGEVGHEQSAVEVEGQQLIRHGPDPQGGAR